VGGEAEGKGEEEEREGEKDEGQEGGRPQIWGPINGPQNNNNKGVWVEKRVGTNIEADAGVEGERGESGRELGRDAGKERERERDRQTDRDRERDRDRDRDKDREREREKERETGGLSERASERVSERAREKSEGEREREKGESEKAGESERAYVSMREHAATEAREWWDMIWQCWHVLAATRRCSRCSPYISILIYYYTNIIGIIVYSYTNILGILACIDCDAPLLQHQPKGGATTGSAIYICIYR
jgi:hypothetical protein